MLNITTQLDDEAADKLAYIQQLTHQELNQILTIAIDSYYQKLQQEQPREESTYQKFQASGLIGCVSVEENLSTTYKQVLFEELDQKYDHR